MPSLFRISLICNFFFLTSTNVSIIVINGRHTFHPPVRGKKENRETPALTKHLSLGFLFNFYIPIISDLLEKVKPMTTSPKPDAISILASLAEASNRPPNKPPETDETKPRPWEAPQLASDRLASDPDGDLDEILFG